jgi:hypothetical protein
MNRKNRKLLKSLSNNMTIVKSLNSYDQTGRVVQMTNNNLEPEPEPEPEPEMEMESEIELKKYLSSSIVYPMGNGYRTIKGSKTHPGERL